MLDINPKYDGPMCAPGHDGLEDAGEGCHPDTRGHEDTRTACWLQKMLLAGALWGPEM